MLRRQRVVTPVRDVRSMCGPSLVAAHADTAYADRTSTLHYSSESVVEDMTPILTDWQ